MRREACVRAHPSGSKPHYGAEATHSYMSNRSYQAERRKKPPRGPLGSKGEKGAAPPGKSRHHAAHAASDHLRGNPGPRAPSHALRPRQQQGQGLGEAGTRPPCAFARGFPSPHRLGGRPSLPGAEGLGGRRDAPCSPGAAGAEHRTAWSWEAFFLRGASSGPHGGPRRNTAPTRSLSPPSSSTLSSRDSLLTLRTGPELKPSRRPLRPQTVADSHAGSLRGPATRAQQLPAAALGSKGLHSWEPQGFSACPAAPEGTW